MTKQNIIPRKYQYTANTIDGATHANQPGSTKFKIRNRSQKEGLEDAIQGCEECGGALFPKGN